MSRAEEGAARKADVGREQVRLRPASGGTRSAHSSSKRAQETGSPTPEGVYTLLKCNSTSFVSSSCLYLIMSALLMGFGPFMISFGAAWWGSKLNSPKHMPMFYFVSPPPPP